MNERDIGGLRGMPKTWFWAARTRNTAMSLMVASIFVTGRASSSNRLK
jgi:hypothetical protein